MIAILPLKEHSERIPNKNIKLLSNKPLFFHIIETLLQIHHIKNVVINTDSKRIIDLAIERFKDKIEISFRAEHLRGDFISMNKIIEYEVNRIGLGYDYLQTHSTNPLLKPSTLEAAINRYYKNKDQEKIDSLFSACEIKSRLYNEKLEAINHDPSNLIRTQDLGSIFEENSNFYIFSGKSFIKNKRRIGNKPDIYVMHKLEGIDIDFPDDWELVDTLMQNLEIRNG